MCMCVHAAAILPATLLLWSDYAAANRPARQAPMLINLRDKDGIKLESIIVTGCPIIARVSQGCIVRINRREVQLK